MKKLFLLIMAVVPMMAAAQVLEVQSVTKMNTPANVDSKIAGVSPAGDYLLLTSVGYGQNNRVVEGSRCGLQRTDQSGRQRDCFPRDDRGQEQTAAQQYPASELPVRQTSADCER